jgi:putative transposase
MNHFKGKQFKKDVIIVAVGYYLRYDGKQSRSK